MIPLLDSQKKAIDKLIKLVSIVEFEIWDNNCRCVQKINPVLFDTEESILSNSLLDDNHRLVYVDYENKIITDIEFYK